MLVLSRQREQSIVIGDDIVITVVDIRGDKVRLGIDAPRSISVHRKEVYNIVKAGGGKTNASEPAPASDSPMISPPTDDPFMLEAIDEARRGQSEGGLPIGSVLVRDGQIIGRGHNRRVQKGDPMAHAEIDCLTHAGRQKTYKDTVLYSTLMPCHLCSGAVVQFGIPRVIVGESVNFHGSPEFLARHGVQVVNLHHAGCIAMMGDFIKSHPELWNEDIGK